VICSVLGTEENEYQPRRTQCGRAATEDEKANFTTKVTKSTKLRSLEISISETFVAFVCFVVKKKSRQSE
jgi:hypothetical protein